jgi:hypothetical protein
LEGTYRLEGNKMTKKKITLPSGATVTLRDPLELRVKDRKKIYANAGKADEGIMQALSLTDGLIAVLVEDWSFDLIIPSIKIESIDELEMADYDFLVDETKDAQKVLFPSLAKTEANEKDAESPLENSNA